MRFLAGKWIAVAALVGLAGCGEQFKGGLLLPLVGRAIPALQSADSTPAAAGFSAAEIAAHLDQYILMAPPTLGPPVPARLIADNGTSRTWLAQVGFSASFNDGLLVATRGLNGDLMAADVSQVRTALNAGGGHAVRVQEDLDDQDQIVSKRFECDILAAGTETIDLGLRQVSARKFEETCRNSSLEFTNLYWLDGTGHIISSRQFISRTVAYLRSNEL